MIICLIIFQITTSVLLVLIIVISMQHVPIRMDHLLALATLDIVETEWLVQVLQKIQYFLLFVGIVYNIFSTAVDCVVCLPKMHLKTGLVIKFCLFSDRIHGIFSNMTLLCIYHVIIKADLQIKGSSSAIRDHINESGHAASVNDFSILDRANNDFDLLIHESLLILRDRPELNSQQSSIPLVLF